MQPSLGLTDAVFDPHSREGMRVAYEQAGLERYGIPFDEAIEDKGMAIAMRLHAEAIARQLQKIH